MSNTQLLINQLLDWLIAGYCSSVHFAIVNATTSLYSNTWKGHGKLMECTLTAWKVHGRYHRCTECGTNFDRRLHVHPRDLPWNSINFLCMYRTFRQFQVRREDSLSKNGVIKVFLSTTCVSTSTFRVSAGRSINFSYVRGTFYQVFVCSWDLQ